MMVNGRHTKNTFPAQLEQNLLLDDHRNDAQRPSKGERTNIAHKKFGGMRVVPQKSQRRSDQRPAQYRQLSNSRDVLNLEIGGPAIVAAHVGQNRQRARRDYRASD